MPTGSLCAERNVMYVHIQISNIFTHARWYSFVIYIFNSNNFFTFDFNSGTALATHPNIRRQDIVMVAVLALTLPNENPSPSPLQLPSPPPGTSSMCTLITETEEPLKESSVFFSEVEEKLSRFQRPENMRRSISIGSFASIVEGSDSHETDDSWEKMSSNEKTSENSSEVVTKNCLVPSESIPTIITEATDSVTQTGLSTPVRKIKLYAGGDTGNNRHDNSKTDIFRRKKRTVIVHSAEVSQVIFHVPS